MVMPKIVSVIPEKQKAQYTGNQLQNNKQGTEKGNGLGGQELGNSQRDTQK